jgi:hypothetical protein
VLFRLCWARDLACSLQDVFDYGRQRLKPGYELLLLRRIVGQPAESTVIA